MQAAGLHLQPTFPIEKRRDHRGRFSLVEPNRINFAGAIKPFLADSGFPAPEEGTASRHRGDSGLQGFLSGGVLRRHYH